MSLNSTVNFTSTLLIASVNYLEIGPEQIKLPFEEDRNSM